MKELIAYSAIKSFYDNKNDLLEIVCFFILQTIDKEITDSEKIQQRIIRNFGLNIPIDVICSALKRLRNNNNYIIYSEKFTRIALTKEGEEKKLASAETIENTRRESNALIQNLKEYFKTATGQEISAIDLGVYLKEYILNGLFNVGPSPDEQKIPSKYFVIIGSYFEEKDKNDPENYNRLKSIVYGQILSSILEKDRVDEKVKLKKLNIYFDSNIIFSLMGLHAEYYNTTAKEMVAVLKKFGFDLKIFNFTLDEVRTKLLLYPEKQDQYFQDIEVNSIYSRMKLERITEAELMTRVNNLEEELGGFGIKIDYYTSVSLTEEDNAIALKLIQRKEEKRQWLITNPEIAKHDIAVIKAIRLLRGKSSFRIEDSNSIFLTADTVLAKFDFDEFGHKERQTIPEVFFRGQMVNFLWLKNPEIADGLPIKTLLNSYVKTKIISQRLWETFRDELKKQFREGKLTEEDIAGLISLMETRNILRDIETESKNYVKDINDKIINGTLIEKARRTREEAEVLKKYKKETESVLRIRNDQLEKANAELKSQREKIDKINKKIGIDCAESMKKRINLLGAIMYIVFWGLVVWGAIKINLFSDWNNLCIIITLLIPVFATIFFLLSFTFEKSITLTTVIIDWKKGILNDLTRKCIQKKKNKYGAN